MKRLGAFFLAATLWFIITGCSNSPTGNSDDGNTTTDITGTWSLSETVTAADTVTVHPDSASLYLVVTGTAVTMYSYTPGTAPTVQTGTYTGTQLIFGGVTYDVRISNNGIELQAATDSTITYGCSAFTGSVPPASWPAPEVQDDTYEPGDDGMTGATNLTAGTAQAHTISDEDQDWFSVTLLPGYMHTVTIAGTTEAYGLRVFDADSSRVYGWSGSGVTIDEDAGTVIFTVVKQETFYLRLQGTDAAVYTITLSSAAIPASPYTGSWYLAADTVSYPGQSGTVAETSAYSAGTTPEIAEFKGSLLLRHMSSVEGTWTDTSVFIYINTTTAVVNGDTVAIWRSGSGLRVVMETGRADYLWRQSRLFLPYSGAIPPAHWNDTPLLQAQKRPASN